MRRVLTWSGRTRGTLIGFIIAVVVDAIVDGDPAAARADPDRHTRSPTRTARWSRCIALAAVGARLRRRDALACPALLSSRVGEGLIYDLRVALFDHVQRMPLAFFTRTQTGALQSRLNNDVVGAQQAVTTTLGTVCRTSSSSP